jgi:hypothetical protein
MIVANLDSLTGCPYAMLVVAIIRDGEQKQEKEVQARSRGNAS